MYNSLKTLQDDPQIDWIIICSSIPFYPIYFIMIQISIIIPTYNHLADCLKPCIESIIKYTNLCNVEVIIVANGCKDGTLDYLKSLDKNIFKYIWFDEPIGYPKSINEGIKKSSGNYILLLNNDIILLEQEKNKWIDMLVYPLKKDKDAGLSGPILGYSGPADRNFLVFFCAMIKKEVIDKVGMLDEIFTPGGGEDTDFCIRAEDNGYKLCQAGHNDSFNDNMIIGNFPIYHKGEATVHDKKLVPNWSKIFDRNSNILLNRYNKKWKLSNNCERAVIGKNDVIPPREYARYQKAYEYIKENNCKKILEIGCSSGYGIRILKDIYGLDYLGIDYDNSIIDYATKEFSESNIKFEVNNILEESFWNNLETYDAIIAFEVLEHVDNGREIAQRLKEFCKLLLITAPFSEIKGLWGFHHKLHNLTEKDFPDFSSYEYISENGNFINQPERFDGMNLLFMKYDGSMDNKNTVTVDICTNNRYFSTLPVCLMSIVTQSVKPNKVIIVDDTEKDKRLDLREISIYKNIFSLFDKNNIKWEVVFGDNRGQVFGHNIVLEKSNTEFIWRIDDDEFAENNVLETLMKNMNEDIGAVSCSILDPKIHSVINECKDSKVNLMENIFSSPNFQWNRYSKNCVVETEHLYSSFLYKKEAAKHGFCKDLSKVGHREETIFSYEIFRKGWKLIIDTSATIWHLREDMGGIREENNDRSLWDQDEKVFRKILSEYKIEDEGCKLIVLDSGLGDHYIFKSVFSEIRKIHPNKQFILAVCYPEVFKEYTDIDLISISDASEICNIDKYNIYKYCIEHNWEDRHISEAFLEMYS